MEARHKLNKKGYIRLYGYVPDALCDELLAAAKDRSLVWKRVFGKDGDPKQFDPKRMMADAPPQLMSRVFAKIEEGCKTFFPEGSPTEWRFLKSLKGGAAQLPHRDFKPLRPDQDKDDSSLLPSSLMIGLQDGTRIYGYGWNRQIAEESERDVIEFGRGDVLLFRGDFIHSGADYKTDNVRIHCFLEPPMEDSPPVGSANSAIRDEDSVDLVAVFPKKSPVDKLNGCYIYECDQSFRKEAQLWDHIRNDHRIRFNNYPRSIVQPKGSERKQPKQGVPDSGAVATARAAKRKRYALSSESEDSSN